MGDWKREFVSFEERTFGFKIGRYLASALAGFIAGVLATSAVWYLAIQIFFSLAG